MSYDEVKKLKKSKTLKDNSKVGDLTRFKLIHEYWLKKAPSTDRIGGSHKLALEKFIKKARKDTMKGNTSLDATLECDYSSLGSKKKNKKKFKQMVKGRLAQMNTSMKIKQEDDETGGDVKPKKVPKIEREEENTIENSPFSYFKNKTSPKKMKVKNNEETLNASNTVEATDKVMKKKKKKRKSNSTVTTAELTDNTVDSSYFENSTLNASIKSSFDAKSTNSDNVFETPKEQNLTKKQKKKKNVSFNISGLSEDISADVAEEQNVSEQSITNISSKKGKKKKLSQLNISEIKVKNEIETTNVQKANKIESRKDKKKRKLLEAKIGEEDQFGSSDNELAADEQPKKKRKINSSASEINDETNQNKSKSGKKLKKKKKKLEGIVPGLDSQPTLTKFTLNKEESLNEDESDSDDEISFPRTPNNRSFNQKWDSEEKNNRTLFVGNLPTDVTKKNLMQVFKNFGNIESVRIRGAVPAKPSIPQKVANFKKEYNKDVKSLNGYVVFSDKENAEKALTLNGQVFNGHHLRVDKASWKKSSPGSQPQYNKGCSVFIGGLPYDVDDELVRKTFTRCGAIENVRIIRDRETGKSKGFGFIQFQEERSIANALTLSGTEINGREIRVKPYEDNAKKSPSSEIPQQNARSRIFNSERKGNQSRRPRKFFNKNFRKNDEQDSGPKKSFKKMQKKWKVEKEKKKVASLFKNED